MHEAYFVVEAIEAEWRINLSAICSTIGWEENLLPLWRYTPIYMNTSLLSIWHLTATFKYHWIKIAQLPKKGLKML